MRCSPSALAAVLAVLGLSAWAQVGDGPLAPMTTPPSIYSSAPPSIAVSRPQVAARPPSYVAPPVAPLRLTGEARDERMFLRTAAAQSRFELAASRIAFAKSTNGKVRALAASLINHHNTVGLELAHLLHSRAMAMPMPSNEQSRAIKQLNKLAGSKFDALYLQQVGLAQAAVARDYEKASATIREPQINAWIVKTLANTRFHQNMAERAAPAEPQLGKLTRTPRPQVKEGMTGLQPVAATGTSHISGSDTR